MSPDDDSKIIHLLKENTALARENNVLLKKLRRNSIIDLCFRLAWYAFLIGLPFALYFYILGPYLEALGFSSEHFRVTAGEVPAVKIFQSMFGGK